MVTGRARVTASLPAGAALTLEHFEATEPDGSYHNSVQSAMGVTEQKDTFISDGAAHTYEAKFTFHGFRYVRVTGLDEPNPAQFTAVVLASDKADAGTFACSDARLNRLYENTRWSQRGNTLSIPTDCPQREKAGWTGDIALYARTMLLNEDATSFLTRWLHSLACDQRENGSVPFTVPGHLDLPLQWPCDGRTDRLRWAGVLGRLGRRGHRGALGNVRDHRQHRNFENSVRKHEGMG